MEKQIRTQGNDKRGDYWFLDRSRSIPPRLLLVSLVLLAVTLGSGGCATNMQSLQEQYQAAHSDGAARGTSDLLGTTTSVLTTTTDTLTDTTASLTGTVTETVEPTLAIAAPSAKVTVALESSNWALSINSTGEALKDARVVCSTGETLGFSLADYSGKVSFPKQKTWNFVAVSGSNGGKWYFDNAGLPLPNGYTPRISVLPGATSLTGTTSSYTISSSDAVSDVRFFYSNGAVSNTMPDRNGRVSTLSGANLSYISIGVRYDSGSKWYFDRSGRPLPTGYVPTVSSTWKNQSLALNSSDMYDKVVIFFTDYSKDSYSTNESSGLYKPFRARTAEGYMLRLKSDGSKWYFDNAGLPVPSGAKWFSDMD